MGVLFKSGSLSNIANIMMKIDGKMVSNLPLQMKIDGVIVNFMLYGPTLEEIKLLVPVSPVGFDAEKISNIINKLGKYVDSVEVSFENGEFICNKPIIITVSNVALRGESNTIIKCNGDFSNYNGQGYYGVVNFIGKNGAELENLVLEGVTINGDKSNASHKSLGVYCNYVSSVTRSGISIKNCFINNNKSYGIYLLASNNNNITNNIIDDNANNGIELGSSRNNIITGNTCCNDYYGIYLHYSFNNIIIDNIINDNGWGIYIDSSYCNSIIGNVCYNNSNDGIWLRVSNENNIIGNNCSNNSYTGIYIYNSSSNTITGNTCSNNNYGIYLLSNSNYNLIQGNNSINSSISNMKDDVGSNKLNHNILV